MNPQDVDIITQAVEAVGPIAFALGLCLVPLWLLRRTMTHGFHLAKAWDRGWKRGFGSTVVKADEQALNENAADAVDEANTGDEEREAA